MINYRRHRSYCVLARWIPCTHVLCTKLKSLGKNSCMKII